MDWNPSEVGAVAEREVAYALSLAGHGVYVPFFNPHSRTDLVAEIGSQVLRIQVKSAVVSTDVVSFRCCSNTANIPKDYIGEIDAFGVHCPSLGTNYLVPIDDLPTRMCHLRLAPPRNNQVKGIRWAADYEIGPGSPR